jgi:hypothetical protein
MTGKHYVWICTALLAAVSATGQNFVDVTAKAGISFKHSTGATGKKLLPETLGSGCAFVDLDGDGFPDILLLNGSGFPALYHNNRNGTFTDVTAASGLKINMKAMGVAVGDYDNDGRPDLYITTLDGDHLFHNEGGMHFRDVTKQSGIVNVSFGTSATWFDYDRDGKLDLFVANYVEWSPEKDIYCTLDGRNKSYCTPESYKGTTSRLFHNLGNGTFEDVTKKAGLYDTTSKALGVVALDYDMDGWPDLLVANDTQPNKLYHNNGNGTFTERGVAAGIAFSEDGVARAGMGVDSADYDGSGFPSVVIGNFSNQMLGLYHNEGKGLFVDEAPSSAVGRASLLTLAFGMFFFDYDNDGLIDLFIANGHLDADIHKVQQRVFYAMPPHLFRNLGGKRFEDVVAKVGPDLQQPKVARGAAYADLDGDGYLDLLVTTNGGEAHLYRNTGGDNHSLRVRLQGAKSNRQGVGARVRVETSRGWQWQSLKAGQGYCSSSEDVRTFGLGRDAAAKTVEIVWPGGDKERITNLAAGQTYTVKEGAGIAESKPYAKAKVASDSKPAGPGSRGR